MLDRKYMTLVGAVMVGALATPLAQAQIVKIDGSSTVYPI